MQATVEFPRELTYVALRNANRTLAELGDAGLEETGGTNRFGNILLKADIDCEEIMLKYLEVLEKKFQRMLLFQ